MNLRQINLSYIEAEDRLLLRMNTTDGAEFRFWLTRRIAVDLLARLESAERKQLGGVIAADFPGSRAIAEFQREVAVGQADFSSDFVPGRQLPLGEPPLLVVGITCQPEADQTALSLLLATRQRLDLMLDRKMLHCLVTLTVSAASTADWGIDGPVKEPSTVGDKGAAPLVH